MSLPTWRLGVLIVAALPLLALADRWPGLAWIVIGWWGVVTFLVAADWRLTPGPSAWSLRREHEARLSLAAPNRVAVRVRLGRGVRVHPIQVRDTPPSGFKVRGEDRVIQGAVAPYTTATLAYELIPPRRGAYAFGDLYLRWESVLGLFERQARYLASGPVKVYPNLADVHKFDLFLRRNRLWELGVRSARLRGQGTEFERLRDYQPDDDYRRINWKATARRGRPITAEYQTERSQNVVAVMDVGRMMRSPVGEVAKMDYVINAVLLLAYVATAKGDRVGALTFADAVQAWLAPRGGRGQFHRLLEVLYRVEGSPVEPNFGLALGELGVRHQRHSLVLVFTDLTGSLQIGPLVAGLSRLRRRHQVLLVTIADPAVAALAAQTVRDSTSLYQRTIAESLLAERALAVAALRRYGVATLDVSASELSLAVVNRYLEMREAG